MPTQSKTVRLPDGTVDEVTDLRDHFERSNGFRPSEAEIFTRAIRDLHAAVCQTTDTTPTTPDKAAARNARARENRLARSEAMRSVGMKKVRGNLGGTYWE